jgi:Ca-activated chloride channel family protein
MNLSGQLSLGNALFWSVLTPIIIWQIWKILDLPFFGAC